MCCVKVCLYQSSNVLMNYHKLNLWTIPAVCKTYVAHRPNKSLNANNLQVTTVCTMFMISLLSHSDSLPFNFASARIQFCSTSFAFDFASIQFRIPFQLPSQLAFCFIQLRSSFLPAMSLSARYLFSQLPAIFRSLSVFHQTVGYPFWPYLFVNCFMQNRFHFFFLFF